MMRHNLRPGAFARTLARSMIFLIILLTALPVWAEDVFGSAKTKSGRLNAVRVNLRSAPSLQAPILHRLDQRGTAVEVIGQDGKWLHLAAPVDDAWIFADYVDLDPVSAVFGPEETEADTETAAETKETDEISVMDDQGVEDDAGVGVPTASDVPEALAAEEIVGRTDPEPESLTAQVNAAVQPAASPVEEIPADNGHGPLVTMTAAVRTAVENHPSVLASRASYQAAEAGVDEDRAGFFPSVDLRLGTGSEYSDNETTRRRKTGVGDAGGNTLWRKESSLSVSQMLFDGFSTRYRTQAAEARVAVADARFENTIQDIALRTIQAYLDTLLQRELVVLARQNVADHEAVLAQSRFRAEAGGGTTADVEQTASRLTAAKAKLVELQGGLRDAETRYKEAVGEFAQGMTLPEMPWLGEAGEVDVLVKQALANHPTILQAQADVTAREKEVRQAEAAYYPHLSLEVSGSSNRNLDGLEAPSEDVTGMLMMRMNIFEGGRDQARQSAARARLREAEYRLATLHRNMEQNARLAANALLTSEERLPVLRENEIASQRVLAAYQGQFDIGKRSLLDLLDAQNELFAVRLAKKNGEFRHLYAHYQVLAAAGGLLPAVGLSADRMEIR